VEARKKRTPQTPGPADSYRTEEAMEKKTTPMVNIIGGFAVLIIGMKKDG
jgi:hypothetical protein